MAAMAVVCALWPAAVSAQDVSESALKAAFLGNFAKFAEWPAESHVTGQPFTFCVIGDPAVVTALSGTLHTHPGGEVFTVVSSTPDAPLRRCHMLYIGGDDARLATRVLDSVRGAPVFTVANCSRFAESGGVAQFIVEDGRMRFAINTAAAQRGRIGLSAKLLSLAILVKDGTDARR